MRHLKSVILLTWGIFAFNSVRAITLTDTAKVSGQLKWVHSSITEFPAHVKVLSNKDGSLIIKAVVDSLGRYTVKLPAGLYTIAPLGNFNWINNRGIRIDDKTSKIALEVLSPKDLLAPVLMLDTVPEPKEMVQKGVMFDFDRKKAAQLDEFIQKQMSFYDIPGSSLALIKKGEVIYHKTYGLKNAVTKEPVDEKTVFEAGSTTKPVFAFAVMRLVEKGIIDLDKPLYQYLPFKDVAHDERYKLITARFVLSHQTGFANWPQRDAKGEFPLRFTPGTAFGYSGEAYEYLKRVVEHVTKKDMGQILKEEVIDPLKWKGVYFTTAPYVEANEANGHFENQPTKLRVVNTPMMSFSMVTEAKSFSTFMLALRNRKELKASSYNEMFRKHSTMEPGVDWGLGFDIESSAYGPVYRHGGSTGSGFICNFSYFPNIDMGYVMFTNSAMGEWLSIRLLTQFLITGKE